MRKTKHNRQNNAVDAEEVFEDGVIVEENHVPAIHDIGSGLYSTRENCIGD